MKKRDIWISIAIIVVALVGFYFYVQGEGQIKIETAGVEMQLYGGLFNKPKVTSQSPITVKARSYRPESLSIAAKQHGDTWRLYSRGPWGKLKRITVKGNKTTVLQPGPPFLIKPDLYKSSSVVTIGLSIIGRAGEHYSAAVSKNGRRPAAPALKIVDESGKVLASGRFTYG